MSTSDWFDELDLDPNGTWMKVGLRRMGSQPWLIADERRAAELALRVDLLGQRRAEVLAVGHQSVAAGAEVLELVLAELASMGLARTQLDMSADDRLHPLEQAGRVIQEDLCLLRRTDDGWIFDAAVLCFPSRWRLADKLGRPLVAVHEPVSGYRSELAGPVDSVFDRIGVEPRRRRNWFLHPDSALFQPDRPTDGDPVVSADGCFDELYVRSERQTLRRLPRSGWVLFTIRIQQDPLGVVLRDDDRRRRFVRYLAETDHDLLEHRGIGGRQAAELRMALNSSFG